MPRRLSSLRQGSLARRLQGQLRYLFETLSEKIASRSFILTNAAAVMTGLIISWLVADSGAARAENFRRVTGTQIQARFSGMDMTDDVHWRDSFGRGGTLISQSMGKRRLGKWRVENNQLCIVLGTESSGCYEVWRTRVEFGREGYDGSSLEGRLEKPGSGNQNAKGPRQ